MWIFLVLIYGVLKGAREIVKKKSLEKSSVPEVLFFYTLIGFVFLLPEMRDCMSFDRSLFPLILVKALCVFLAWIASFNVIKKMPVSIYGILDMARVLFAYLLGIIILSEKITIYQMIGMPLVLVGLYLLRVIKGDKDETASISPLTLYLAFLSCALNAISGLLDKIIMKGNITSGQLQFWYMYILVLLYAVYLFFGNTKIDTKSLKKNYWVIILAVIFIIGDRALFMANAYPGSKITVMTLIKQSACFVTIVLGKIVYKEKDLRKKLICAGVVTLGIVIATLGDIPSKSAETNGEIRGNYTITEEMESIEVPTETKENYDKDAVKLDIEKLKETIAVEGTDAGQEYIDETLFIGDSNTVRMMNYGFTSLNNTLAVTGMGIQSVESLKCIEFEGKSSPVTIIEAVKIMQPKRIIITYGTNNASGMEVDSFIKKYKEVLSSIHEAYSYADIIINSVPPFHKVNSYPNLKMSNIDKYNVALCEMANELGYKFLDTASVLKDENTGYAKDEYTVNDGIHITKAGFEAMFLYIRTHSVINEDTRPKPLKDVPKQKGTVYVISNDGKISHDPKAFGDMSDKDNPVTLPQIQPVQNIEENAVVKEEIQPEIHVEEQKHEHKSDGGTVEKEPTYYENGLKIYRCTECGEELLREEIPRLIKQPEKKPEPELEPKPDPKPEPEPEPKPEPKPEPEPSPEPTPDPEPKPEPTPEPSPEPGPEPTPEPTPEPEPTPSPEPTPEPSPEPEPTPEPAPESENNCNEILAVIYKNNMSEDTQKYVIKASKYELFVENGNLTYINCGRL